MPSTSSTWWSSLRMSLRPDGSFLRPRALAVATLECFCCLLQSSWITAALVTRDTEPVERFRSRIRAGQRFYDIIVASLRLFPLLPGKRGVSEPKLELRKKVVRRQKTFELMALGPVGIQHLDRWRPLRAEALKYFWLLFDMDSYGDVIVIDESFNTRVGINLGIQPSASSSHRSCVEIY